MNQRKRSRFLCSALLTCLLFGAFSANEKGTEAISGSDASGTSPVPTLSTEMEIPSPAASATLSLPLEEASSITPYATPTPEITVRSYVEETGEIRTHVSGYDPQTGYSYSKKYLDGALVEMFEHFYGSFTENADSAHIERDIYYRDGVETFREEKRDILASSGQLLEQVEIVNGLYYDRGIEWLYTDGLPTGYYLYLENRELLKTGVLEYNEKKQLVYEKYTNVQTNRVVSEVAYEYYENGKEKVERRTEPQAYVRTRYENGRTHTFEGYNEDGVWRYEELYEDGLTHIYESYDEEGVWFRYEYDEEGNVLEYQKGKPDKAEEDG